MTPYSKEGGWNIVALGRWIGIVVVVSALLVGAYDFLWFVATARDNEAADRQLLQGLSHIWRSILYLGSIGVIVILLAELLDRVTWDDDVEEPGEGREGDNQDGIA